MSECCPPTTDATTPTPDAADPVMETPGHAEVAEDLEAHAGRNLQIATSGKDLDGADVAEGMRLFALAAAQGQAALAQSHRLATLTEALESTHALVVDGDAADYLERAGAVSPLEP